LSKKKQLNEASNQFNDDWSLLEEMSEKDKKE